MENIWNYPDSITTQIINSIAPIFNSLFDGQTSSDKINSVHEFLQTPDSKKPFVENILMRFSSFQNVPLITFTTTGFFGPTQDSNLISIYLTSNASVQPGMLVSGIGISSPVIVTEYKPDVFGDVVVNPGPPAISFPYVSLAKAVILSSTPVRLTAPSSLLQITFSTQQFASILTTNAYGFRGPLSGTEFSLYIVSRFSSVFPKKGWSIKGLSDPNQGLNDVAGNVIITSDVSLVSGNAFMLSGTTQVTTQYMYSVKATTDSGQFFPTAGSNVFITFNAPSAKIESSFYSLYDPKIFDASAIKGQPAELRDLNANVWTHAPAPQEAYIEMSGRGFGTGALTALAAIGPQEKYVYGGESLWIPNIIQHTPFVITQRLLNPLLTTSKFLDSTQTYTTFIYPRESGDLLANMYLSVTLPAGYTYTPLVGRAILKKVEFLVGNQVIETLTDDWYILRDQLFLDADEKLAMYQAVSGGYNESQTIPATEPLNLMIPLDFFFCRRHTHSHKGREKLEKPFFPTCAVLNQVIGVRFTFNNPAWITGTPDANLDLINPRVLIEEITLSPHERLYYQRQKLTYKVNHVWAEAGQPYVNGKAIMNLTANFPVSMITWFVRNQLYESQDPDFYASRYQYGYSTDYIQAAVPVTFFNGVSINFFDIIQQGIIYLNNQNVLSNFPGALYYSYKQPLDHGLSVPTKNIYMYCFGENPREYNQTGTIDFSKLNAKSTHLDLTFDPVYAPQITQSYTMYLYYYGYVTLQIAGGSATLLSQ